MSALRKVLVVDDDPVVGRSFDRVLSGRGYVVVTAENAQEALNRLGSETYDMVFTDIRMPGISGLELAEQMNAQRPWIPVVIVTGYGTAEHEARAEAAGVAGFLHKPLSPEMITYGARMALRDRKHAPAGEPAPEAAATEAATDPAKASTLKNIALFFAAPFVGLAYIIAFPFVGLGMIAWMAAKAAGKYHVLRQTGRIVRSVGLLIASPFIGLAYVVLFPFIGLAMLAWMGVRALVKRSDPE